MRYCYANFTVVSDFDLHPLQITARSELPSLCTISSANGQLPEEACVDWQYSIPTYQGNHFLSLGTYKQGYLVRVFEALFFIISSDRRHVSVIDKQGLPANTIVHILIDQILPRILSANDKRVVHASAVRIHGVGIAMIGDSGWGKSTLALAFERNGYGAVSDDVVVLTRTDDQYNIHAPYSGFRVWPDTVQFFNQDPSNLDTVSHYNSKTRMALSSARHDETLPVGAAFVLNAPDTASQTIEIHEISGQKAVTAMIESAFRFDIRDRQLLRAEFEQFTQFVRDVPFFSLSYPREYAMLSEVCNHVADFVRELVTTQRRVNNVD